MNVSIKAIGPGVIGTQVLVDGVPMKGVRRVKLVADVDDGVWRAVIYCMPAEVEVTAIENAERRFVSVSQPSSLAQ